MMWPWSTISGLRAKLSEAQDAKAHLQMAYAAAYVNHEKLTTDLNVADKRRRKAEDALGGVKRDNADLRAQLDKALGDLAEARRNDQRDPKTGRFKKGGV